MRIDKIEICNLGTFEGEHAIDFTQEPLRSAGIVAIAGSNGSGRHLLLDAVSLALYGRSPRYDNKGESLLRRSRDEGYARVTFSLPGGTSYVAQWTVRKKKNGAIDIPQQSLKQLHPRKSDVNVANVADYIAEMADQTYDQFCCTMLLRQKDFSLFVKANGKDRSQLLERLTSTEEYGNISRIIYEKSRLASQRYEESLQKIEGIKLNMLDNDHLTKLQEGLTLLKGQVNRDEATLKRIRKQLNWYTTYNQAKTQLDEQKKIQFDAQREYNSLYDKKQVLERFDSVLPFQGIYYSICQTEQEINQFKEQISLGQKELHEHNRKMELLKQEYSVAKNRYEEAKNQYEHKQGHLSRGYQLKGEMAILKDNLRRMEEENDSYTESLRNRNSELLNRESERDELTHKIDILRQRLQVIAMHRPFIEKIESMKALLQKLHEEQEIALFVNKQIAEAQQQLEGAKEQINKLNQERNRLNSSLQSLKDELRIHNQANHGISSVDLQQRLSRLSDMHRRSKGALTLWKRIAARIAETEEKEADVRRREISVEHIHNEIAALRLQLTGQTENRDVLRQSYMLSLSDNMKGLRKQLREGNACPVCGASHHPYHSETEQELGVLIGDLETSYKEAVAEVSSIRTQLSEKLQQLAGEEGQLQMVRDELAETRKRLEYDRQEWKDFENLDQSFKDTSSSVSMENRQMMIVQLLESSEREMQKQQNFNEQFNQHQEAINQLNDNIRKITEQLQVNFHNLSEMEAEQRVCESRIADRQKIQEENDHAISIQISELDNIITVPLWKDRWKEGHDSFIQYLINIADEWNECTKGLQKAQNQEFRLQEDINALFSWIDEKKNAQDDLQNSIHITAQQINHKEEEMRNMFGNLTLEETIHQLHTAISTNHKAEEEIGQTYKKELENLQKLEGKLTDIRSQQQRCENQLQQLRSELDLRISRFNNDHSTLQYFELEKLFTDDRDWTALRQEIEGSQQKLNEITYKVEATSRQILALQQESDRPTEDSDETEIALQNRLEMYETHYQDVKKKLEAAELEMKNHQTGELQLEKCEAESRELGKSANQWKQLANILGSTDGDAFRILAQKQAIKIIVGFANRNLAQAGITFRIEIADDGQQLRIADHSMLNQNLPLNSLSEGNLFLLTTGLALGLSEWQAGGSEPKTFFIDGDLGNLSITEQNELAQHLAQWQQEVGGKLILLTGQQGLRHPRIRIIQLIKGAAGRIHLSLQ